MIWEKGGSGSPVMAELVHARRSLLSFLVPGIDFVLTVYFTQKKVNVAIL
jgi:hypothetical protein